jgi:hypothetical protein
MKNKNKVNQTRAAQIYSRAVQKDARKSTGLSNDAAKADKAEVDARIADLRSKSSELPALRAENERLQDKREDFIFKVAGLAAQINPKLFEENPTVAIKLALKRLKDTRRVLNEIVQQEKAKEAKAAIANVRVKYQRGVKVITGDKKWDRARDKFKRYVAAEKLTEGRNLEEALAHYRQHVFTGPELVIEIRDFERWWKHEKSGQARKSARGRVKRKRSDLRITENRRHKQGYCRKCGKRVRPHERLCDKHVKGKPLLFYTGGLNRNVETGEVVAGDIARYQALEDHSYTAISHPGGFFVHFRAMHLPNHPDSSIFSLKGGSAFTIYGAIRHRWAELGWDGGKLGFPTSEESDVLVKGVKARRVNFENGYIVWSLKTGPRETFTAQKIDDGTNLVPADE